MEIWVDADACPVAIKEILFTVAERTGVKVTLVANQPIRIPGFRILSRQGFDVADREECRDLVVTADIPLAAEAMENGVHALSPRVDSTETIR